VLGFELVLSREELTIGMLVCWQEI
jgi:hypothetical protein